MPFSGFPFCKSPRPYDFTYDRAFMAAYALPSHKQNFPQRGVAGSAALIP